MEHSLEVMKIYKDFIKSPVGIVIDGFMNSIPGYNGAWIAMKNAIELNKNMKILRGLELLELFQDEKFQSEFLQSEQAVDGFGLCFESIVKQRNEKKRKIIKNILLGFTELSEEQKKEFELERFLEITNYLSYDDIKLISIYIESKNTSIISNEIDIIKKRDRLDLYQIQALMNSLFGEEFIGYEINDYRVIVNNLITRGLLIDISPGIWSDNGELLIITKLGEKFINYLSDYENT